MDIDIVGRRIRERREQLGLTQDQLAVRMQTRGHAHLGQNRISEIEAGRRYVRPAELIGFSRALGVSITWLLGVPDSE